ncbi:thioesterase family protein [Bradyrhizobium sp. AUGA SZCCT0431]|uniref:thioesterase family protein n=1 Tax=Bradyrhizobium sp. AUGA SZCCT0431 TaxID=2807674 RepID=UPI001BADB132|nr:hypothetical protein [Bradyrhizobium sp. AUGA SZCCT0431]MBR1146194.1 hypothetical protein [Bradyrhizobium sp. AUGA SZCCT0431]
MMAIVIGETFSCSVSTTSAHTAHAFGNDGVHLIGTPALIGFLETASNGCIKDAYDEGEASVGTSVNVRHRAAAPKGATIDASARVTAVQGQRVEFAVSARWNGILLMEGTHTRTIVVLPSFLKKFA